MILNTSGYICRVNKICLIFLLPVIMLNASFCELLKVPQLVSHFIKHKELNANIGFVTFIEMHYLGQDINDNDQEEDMKLPFKKIDGHHMFSLGVPQGKTRLIAAPAKKISSKQVFRYQVFVPNPYTTSLLRPPTA
ncbi:hypothetical protein SAMN04488024_101497 [Pedobacter soli]|uniref:Uncharacterized protein n=1 Tax=Pedobacter soli TaxID=390242 RepID=A0A1G6JPA9_9SPHI|nr:hypothetical protein SAMN04488024_101497 [Pedobacter soli]